jgi:transglutaminase-like putative cysteine protease
MDRHLELDSGISVMKIGRIKVQAQNQMLIEYGFHISIETVQPTPVLARLDVHPDRRHDIVSEQNLIGSGIDIAGPQLDLFGNLSRRFTLYPGTTTLEMRGTIVDRGLYEPQLDYQRALPIAELPGETLGYLVASRYCETDLLSPLAWQLFGHLEEGAPRVRAIVDFVHNRLRFGYRFARDTRTANEALNEGVGVCRDFAHLTVALCRCLNIPARYVNGYLGDIGVPRDPAPMDFSAWAEVYLGGSWYTVDARHNEPRIGRIVIARGRDAMDVPMVHTFGPHILKKFLVTTAEVDSLRAAA